MNGQPAQKQKGSGVGFFILILMGVGIAVTAAYIGKAPVYSPYFEDWREWSGIDRTTSVVLLLGLVVMLAGVMGLFVWMFSPSPKSKKTAMAVKQDVPLSSDGAQPHIATGPEAIAGLAADAATATLASRRPSLKFDTETLKSDSELPVVNLDASSAQEPLAPQEFTDNAPDGFLPPQRPEPSAEIIALKPEPIAMATSVPTTHEGTDLIAKALLAEAPETHATSAPESDINAVVNSAMSLIAKPEITPSAVLGALPPLPLNEVAAPLSPPVDPEKDREARLNTALEKSLSHLPVETRPIASDEIKARLDYLNRDNDAQVRNLFDQIHAGDFQSALSGLNALAQARSAAGNRTEAAELWRAFAALHMGRDDATALNAYEKVSDLDPQDGKIHTYLARRYTMDGRQAAIRPMLQRALASVSDSAARAELLQQYGDLSSKVADHDEAAKAFEELQQIQTYQIGLNPANLQLRSAQAVTLARLGQIRETQGLQSDAGRYFRQAAQAFSDLSAAVPDHAGLKAMAQNAAVDAQRFNA